MDIKQGQNNGFQVPNLDSTRQKSQVPGSTKGQPNYWTHCRQNHLSTKLAFSTERKSSIFFKAMSYSYQPQERLSILLREDRQQCKKGAGNHQARQNKSKQEAIALKLQTIERTHCPASTRR